MINGDRTSNILRNSSDSVRSCTRICARAEKNSVLLVIARANFCACAIARARVCASARKIFLRDHPSAYEGLLIQKKKTYSKDFQCSHITQHSQKSIAPRKLNLFCTLQSDRCAFVFPHAPHGNRRIINTRDVASNHSPRWIFLHGIKFKLEV